MASVSSGVNWTVSEDQFVCPICLEVFTDPVTTPCGHSFCQVCITRHWDSRQYNCPLCKQNFNSRPELKVNVVLAGMVSESSNKPNMEDRERGRVSAKPQSIASNDLVCVVSVPLSEVNCDMCLQPKLRAVQSCLNCGMSYCHSHLQSHLKDFHLRSNLLIQSPPEPAEPRAQGGTSVNCGATCVFFVIYVIITLTVLKSVGVL